MSYETPIDQTTVQTAAPSAEPVTLAQAKLHCRIDNGVEDTLLEGLITSARDYVEGFTERSLVSREFVSRFSRFPVSGKSLFLPMCPLVEIDSIEYFNSATGLLTTLDEALYFVRVDTTPGCVQEAYNQSWPATIVRGDAVTVTYTAGYGTSDLIPQRAKQAMLLLIGHWYENRESTSVGVEVKDVPMAVESLLWQLRTGVVR